MVNVIPVVFCFDKRIILGASVAIKSLLDSANEDTIYDVRIFHSDLDLKTQEMLLPAHLEILILRLLQVEILMQLCMTYCLLMATFLHRMKRIIF